MESESLISVCFRIKTNSHVLHSDVFKDLAVVDVPHSLVVPDFGSQQDGSQDDALPVGGADIQLSVGQQALQVHLEEEVCLMVLAAESLIIHLLDQRQQSG